MKPWRRYFKVVEDEKTSCRCSDKVLSPASMALLISYPQFRVKLLSVQISTVIWAGIQSSALQVDLLSAWKSSTMLSGSKAGFTSPSQFPAMENPALYLSLHLNKPVMVTLENSQLPLQEGNMSITNYAEMRREAQPGPGIWHTLTSNHLNNLPWGGGSSKHPSLITHHPYLIKAAFEAGREADPW